ncbi:TetR/AcrR family transcriptional regulator [Rhizobium sp. CNPSo 3968]|uniref:TetR/AcrR family transcriptional regulator n=1 Tax=unclassified Rhizobium TaxID=2613769 RepID=UPI000DE0F980|nr:TetR/AcrR family transcriptional regulator [Rhizobium sp. CNPSo 3968]MBB3286494.1 AcrR family transcriptional regulator [Rhizobium sp. BK252]MBB3401312.1 AcrR family transcriptional regulator [Rhizobium sp. BK289]MBB3413890.1 AcrR family transcriptional regulator [Rhizobium sp. BK284]MBB3481777.1 AcrR family transcriptional regulator [Rhizobium sp. BK347]MDK4719630.1 TetR/AcrR family transcriptional regulator [Rhizobium sp. CNPSo 3968]
MLTKERAGKADQAARRRPRGRPKTANDDARRAEIVGVARATFYELGYGSTTMDLVAARCRISKQTLYKLFPSKADLFKAIIAQHRASMLALPRDPDENLPLVEALEQIFMIDMDEAQEREREAFIHLSISEAQQFPEIATLLHTYGAKQSQQMLADWLSQQQRRGLIEIADVASGARMLMNMIFGAMISKPGHPSDWPDRETRLRHLRQCISIFVAGVQPRKDAR